MAWSPTLLPVWGGIILGDNTHGDVMPWDLGSLRGFAGTQSRYDCFDASTSSYRFRKSSLRWSVRSLIDASSATSHQEEAADGDAPTAVVAVRDPGADRGRED